MSNEPDHAVRPAATEPNLPVRGHRPGALLRLAHAARRMLRWGTWKLFPGFSSWLQRWLADRAERRFDRQFGTETRSLWDDPVRDAPPSSRSNGSPYEATTWTALRRIVRGVTDRPSDWVFVDIGSGKGRALLMAAELGFREVVGVEHSPSLTRVAERNISAYRRRRPQAPPISPVAGDATTIELPAGPLFVFLFNPFGEQAMQAFAENLRRALQASPRPLVVAYLNPRHAVVLDRCGFLEHTDTLLRGTCHVYRAASAAAATGGGYVLTTRVPLSRSCRVPCSGSRSVETSHPAG